MSLFNRGKFWAVYGYDPVKWAKRYDIEPFRYPCSVCGEMMVTTIPIVCGQLRGLSAPPCRCGNEETPAYCVVRDPRFGDLLSGSDKD